jgi:hypothetical protein
VYSLAILLQEEGLYDRSRIYATDMNELVLRKAQSGIFPIDVMQTYAANYDASGGTGALSDYYTAAYDHVVLRQSLRDHVVFAQHNLASDGVFNEFNVILCRNVMIYFTPPLQERVHDLFARSFATFGLLGIGSHESLNLQTGGRRCEPLVAGEKLFRRCTDGLRRGRHRVVTWGTPGGVHGPRRVAEGISVANCHRPASGHRAAFRRRAPGDLAAPHVAGGVRRGRQGAGRAGAGVRGARGLSPDA